MHLKLLGFWFCSLLLFTSVGVIQEVEAVACDATTQDCNDVCTSGDCDITCEANCSYTFTDYVGTVSLEMSCENYPAGGTINGILSVNGVSDNIGRTCPDLTTYPDPNSCVSPQYFVCDDDCTRECIDFEGIAELEMKCNNLLSNTSIEGILKINGDSVTKTHVCDRGGPVCETILSTYDWTASDVTASVNLATCSDPAGCNNFTAVSKTITTNGGTANATISDNNDNSGTCTTSAPAKIDRVGPTGCVLGLTPDGWTNGSVEVSLDECFDGEGSGCATESFDALSTHGGTRGWTSVDQVGNTGAFCMSNPAQIDRVRPYIAANEDGTGGERYACITADGSAYAGDWTNQNVSCSLWALESAATPANGMSGINTLAYDNLVTSSVENLSFSLSEALASQEVELLFEDEVQLEEVVGTISMTDHAGNGTGVLNIDPLNIQIDKTAPVISDFVCESRGADYLNASSFVEGWTNDDVNCSFRVQDDQSLAGLDVNLVAAPSGEGFDNSFTFTRSADAFAVNPDGVFPVEILDFVNDQEQSYSLTITATDAAGNVTSLTEDLDIKIDTIDPVSIEESGSNLAANKCNPGDVFVALEGTQLGNLPGGITDPTCEVLSSDNSSLILVRTEGGSQTYTLPLVRTKKALAEAHETFILDLNINDEDSDINWNTSTLSVVSPSGSTSLAIGSLDFDLETFEITIDASNDLFEAAGDYELHLEILDKAGNNITLNDFEVWVVASEVDVSTSSLFMNTSFDVCTLDLMDNEEVLADGTTACGMTLQLQDRFGNRYENRQGVLLSIDGQEVNGDYDLSVNDDFFVNGIRLTETSGTAIGLDGEGQLLQDDSDNNGEIAFKMYALLPTLNIIAGQNGAQLAEIVAKSLTFDIVTPEVGVDGASLVDAQRADQIATNHTVSNLIFAPWVKLFLSNISGNAASYGTPTNQEMFVGEEFSLYTYMTTGLSNLLPTTVEALITTHANENLFLKEVDMKVGTEATEVYGINFNNTDSWNQEETKTRLFGQSRTGLDIAFTSEVQYEVSDLGADKTVVYPGGNYGTTASGTPLFDADLSNTVGGNESSVSGEIVGAHIEGAFLAQDDEFLVSADDFLVDSVRGSNNQEDPRQILNQNAYELIRGIEPLYEGSNGTSDVYALSPTAFNDSDVVYVKNAVVRIQPSAGDFTVNGAKTIVIEDGNLLIQDDIKYANNNSVLGVILINSAIEDEPAVGNVFIDRNVQEISGYFFADGGLMSVDESGSTAPSASGSNPSDAMLGKQLMLTGGMMTQNTLGGSLLSTPRTPWGVATNVAQAQRYDIHYIRRYTPVIDPDTGLQTNIDDCVQVSTGVCDDSDYAFVVTVDPRIGNIAPPGFSN